MERGDNMVPPLFIWIFQDYPEISTYLFGSLNPVKLNKLYDKISGSFLDYVCIKNKYFFLKKNQFSSRFTF
jgi:hypothetical protein